MNDVTIYTKPGCPYCAAAKDDMQRRGLRYIEHNVKADRAALHRMLELNGNRRHVPTIVQGDQVSVGFSGY
ncbi:MAG TPA: glutaredoxin family protein [Anaerolineae bacterium]|nr:glutaredoxin family protein [Anaerolineae bacterium]